MVVHKSIPLFNISYIIYVCYQIFSSLKNSLMHAFPRDHYNSSTSDFFIHYYQTVLGIHEPRPNDFGKQT